MNDQTKEIDLEEDDFCWIPDNLSNTSVAIWGIGLMGGSLAMALRGKAKNISGIDPNEKVCFQASALNIFDQISTDPKKLLPDADLVILAAPLAFIPDQLAALPQNHPGNAVVLDIGSTKSKIISIMQTLPPRFACIGGHPMCGKEVNTLSNAVSSLFQNTSFALLPSPLTPQKAIKLVVDLISVVGAHPVWMKADQHDQYCASISHLPYLAANSLAAVTPLQAAPLVGPGFISTTRLAEESLEMMMAILSENKEYILPVLKCFRRQIESIENALESDDISTLAALFMKGSDQHEQIMQAFHQEVGL